MNEIHSAPADRTRYWVTHALVPFLAAGVLLVVFENTRLDRALLDPFYDPATRSFPLRHAHVFTLVFKEGTKSLVIALGVAMVVGLVASFKKKGLVPWRRSMLYVLLALAVAPLVVACFKYTSCKHCPWDLDFYGGEAPYAGLLGCPPPHLARASAFRAVTHPAASRCSRCTSRTASTRRSARACGFGSRSSSAA